MEDFAKYPPTTAIHTTPTTLVLSVTRTAKQQEISKRWSQSRRQFVRWRVVEVCAASVVLYNVRRLSAGGPADGRAQSQFVRVRDGLTKQQKKKNKSAPGAAVRISMLTAGVELCGLSGRWSPLAPLTSAVLSLKPLTFTDTQRCKGTPVSVRLVPLPNERWEVINIDLAFKLKVMRTYINPYDLIVQSGVY